MNFFQQIGAEAKNMLRSKFILVFAIIFFVLTTIVIPVGGYIINEYFGYNYYPYNEEYVIIDGVEYENDNELTHMYTELTYQLEWIEQSLSVDGLKHATEISDRLIEFFSANIPLAAQSTRENDYRLNLAYEMREAIINIYVLEQEDLSEAALNEAVGIFGWSEYLTGGMNGGVMYSEYGYAVTTPVDDGTSEIEPLTTAEKQEIIVDLQEKVDVFNELMETDSYELYAEMRKEYFEETIISSNERIEQLEKDVIANPEQEENIQMNIESLLIEIDNINNSEIPELEYRLANNIIENDGSWQDTALNERSYATRRLIYHEMDLYDEQDFNDQHWMVEQYETYEKYLEAMEAERQGYEEQVFIAQSSLDSGKPDMSFVYNGARNQLYGTFYLVMVVVMFGVLVGGWCLASEFQNGTVRLMMIRPRTRMKILLSKYFAGFALLFALYIAIFLVMFVISGVRGGFGDYAYPNYTATGPVNFFTTFIGDFLAVFVSAWFLFTLGFMFSAIARNTAVSIIVPTVVYVGSFIYMNAFTYEAPPPDFVAFTPVPYLLLQDYINPQEWGYISNLINQGFPISLTTGIVVLIVYGLIFLGIGALVFKKRDVTN